MDSFSSSSKSIVPMRESFDFPPKVLYENRYCNLEGFSILACGGGDKNKKRVNQVLEVKVPSFEVTVSF